MQAVQPNPRLHRDLSQIRGLLLPATGFLFAFLFSVFFVL
jgi:hypothetical protein